VRVVQQGPEFHAQLALNSVDLVPLARLVGAKVVTVGRHEKRAAVDLVELAQVLLGPRRSVSIRENVDLVRRAVLLAVNPEKERKAVHERPVARWGIAIRHVVAAVAHNDPVAVQGYPAIMCLDLLDKMHRCTDPMEPPEIAAVLGEPTMG